MMVSIILMVSILYILYFVQLEGDKSENLCTSKRVMAARLFGVCGDSCSWPLHSARCRERLVAPKWDYHCCIPHHFSLPCLLWSVRNYWEVPSEKETTYAIGQVHIRILIFINNKQLSRYAFAWLNLLFD